MNLRHLCSLLSQKQVIKSEESPLKNLENHQMAQMAEPLLLVLSFGHGWLMIIKNDLYVVFIMYEQLRNDFSFQNCCAVDRFDLARWDTSSI